jgi:hypothetical protein
MLETGFSKELLLDGCSVIKLVRTSECNIAIRHVVATIVLIAPVAVVAAIFMVVIFVLELFFAASTAATATHDGFHSIPSVFCCCLVIVHHRHC